MFTTPSGIYIQVQQSQLEMERIAQQDLALEMVNQGCNTTLPALVRLESWLAALGSYLKSSVSSDDKSTINPETI